MIVIHDLANTGSVAALQTADLGRLVATRTEGPGGEGIRRDGIARNGPEAESLEIGGFEVLGRSPESEPRGCSIAADSMFSDESS